MAEIADTAVSIAQRVQLSGTLLAGGCSCLAKVAWAPTDIRYLLMEKAVMNTPFGRLR